MNPSIGRAGRAGVQAFERSAPKGSGAGLWADMRLTVLLSGKAKTTERQREAELPKT